MFLNELGSNFVFAANAWEEGDEVVLITCRFENMNLDMLSENVQENPQDLTNELYV